MKRLSLIVIFLSAQAIAGYSPFGDQHWKAPVSSSGNLPSSGNSIGDVRVETTLFGEYVWNGSSWVAISGGGSSGVTSLNSLTGDIDLVAGSGISVTPAGQNITIAVINPLPSPSPSGDFLCTDGSAWIPCPAPSVGPGTVTDVTATAPIVSSGGSTPDISCDVASGSQAGCLSSSDWNTFNGKQASGNYITALTGDVAASGPGSVSSTIQSNVVSNSKLAQMGSHTYKGNNTGSTANAADITNTQLTADLDLFTDSLQGLVPASGGGTTNFLRADGTWAAVSSPLTFSDSLVNTGGTVTLVNDSATPGNSKYYGTNSGGTLGYFTLPTGFTNPMTTLGDIMYEDNTPAAARLAGNTSSTKKYLSQTGTGSVSAGPVWSQPSFSELSGQANLATQVTGTLPVANQQWPNASPSPSSITWINGSGTPTVTPFPSPSPSGLLMGNSTGTGWTQSPPLTQIGISTDATAYTPTFVGVGTVSNTSTTFERIGDTLYVQGYTLEGTTSASTFSISLPSGLSIDYTKLNSSSSMVVGSIIEMNSTSTYPTTSQGPFLLFADGSTTGTVFVSNAGSTTSALAKGLGNAVFNGSRGLNFSFKLPISGWSSSTIGTGQGSVFASYYLSTNTAFSSSSVVKMDTKIKDTNNAYDTSTGLFTAPVSGCYTETFNGYSTSGTGVLASGKNGSPVQDILNFAGTSIPTTGSIPVCLQAGETTSIYTLGSGMTLAGGSSNDSTRVSFSLNSGNGTGNVSSTGSGSYHIESASLSAVCTTGTCATSWKSGGISSISFNSTGIYDVNLTSGTFSSAPTCFFNVTDTGSGIVVPTSRGEGGTSVGPFTTTDYRQAFVSVGSSPAFTNARFDVQCMGPQ